MSRPSIKRNCSSSGSSSSTSASRSSSIASASCRRCSAGNARIIVATSLACISRRRAASAAMAVLGANIWAISCQSTIRLPDRVFNNPRFESRTLETCQVDDLPALWTNATSLITSSPTRLSNTSLPRSCSPVRVRNGVRLISQDLSRTPELSKVSTRVALTKIRRR